MTQPERPVRKIPLLNRGAKETKGTDQETFRARESHLLGLGTPDGKGKETKTNMDGKGAMEGDATSLGSPDLSNCFA